MWFLLLFVMLLFCAAGLYYLATRIRRFSRLKQLSAEQPKKAWLLACLPLIPLVILSVFFPMPMFTVIAHLIAFWALFDLIFWAIQKLRKRSFRRYYSGLLAIILTLVYLSFGWFFAHHIYQTEYTFQTQKDLGTERLRIVLLADSHLGEMLSAEDFAKQMQRIEDTAPDLVVIAGDFVDDDTSRSEMLHACRTLSELKTTYGVYYVFGNHDKGYMRSRDFSAEELRTTLSDSGVTILEDEAILINDSFYLIGRQDKSVEDRANIAQLTASLDPQKYMIVLNHQPNDYNNEAAANVDLVLSGHTHGGHIFPLGILGVMMGANDMAYGTRNIDGTNFVVTSGIAGWGVPFKTGAISEFVVIDIHGA